jgi:hypothetical protein
MVEAIGSTRNQAASKWTFDMSEPNRQLTLAARRC